MRVDPVSFFRTIVFSRKRFILTKAFSKTLLKKRNWKLSKAFLSQRKRNWHFTNAFLTELKRFRNLSKASQTKLKIVDFVFSNSYYNVAFKLSEAFLSRKRFRFKCVFFFNYVRKKTVLKSSGTKNTTVGVLVTLRHGYFSGCSLFCGFSAMWNFMPVIIFDVK